MSRRAMTERKRPAYMGSAKEWDGWTGPTQYFYFSILRLSALLGKNRPQKAFVPLNIRRVAERLLA